MPLPEQKNHKKNHELVDSSNYDDHFFVVVDGCACRFCQGIAIIMIRMYPGVCVIYFPLFITSLLTFSKCCFISVECGSVRVGFVSTKPAV